MTNSEWKSYWLVFSHLSGSVMGQVQLHYTYLSNFIRRFRWAGHGTYGSDKKCIQISCKTWREEKTGILRHMWEDSIKEELKEFGCQQTGFVWFSIGSRGGLLWTRWWIVALHKMHCFLPSEWLSVARERRCSVELTLWPWKWTFK